MLIIRDKKIDYLSNKYDILVIFGSTSEFNLLIDH